MSFRHDRERLEYGVMSKPQRYVLGPYNTLVAAEDALNERPNDVGEHSLVYRTVIEKPWKEVTQDAPGR